jgi:hypothetical protein
MCPRCERVAEKEIRRMASRDERKARFAAQKRRSKG